MKPNYMKHGFTLVELMIVVLVVGILAAIAIPLMRGNIEDAKWSEANAAAGAVRRSVKTYYAQTGNIVTGQLDDAVLLSTLSMTLADLTGTYFVPGDYSIDSVNANGIAIITVTASQANAPVGSKTLSLDGTWN